MPLSTQQLRMTFKTTFDSILEEALEAQDWDNLYPKIQNLSQQLENLIHEKIQLLEADFQDHPLSGDYLRTVTESFDDLDRLLRNSKTFLDTVQGKSKEEILQHIKSHYNLTLVPLLNIMAKLENDYISIITNLISKKRDILNQHQTKLQKLKQEFNNVESKMLILNKKKKLSEFSLKLKIQDLKRKFLQLSLHHDRLSLYYFNHDHPVELREMKLTVDLLREQLKKFKELENDGQ